MQLNEPESLGVWMAREAKIVAGLGAELEQARAAYREEWTEAETARAAAAHAAQAQEVLGGLAQSVQQKVHQRIASVVSSCLSAVFDDPYEFKIHFERKRGATVAELRFVRNGYELSPMEASGGGAVDVAAFALRAACLVLHRPTLRRLMVLDEPFKFVSEQYQPAIRVMLEQLSRDLQLQIIMVTHNKAYETGTVIDLTP